jgi:hypothetical protein
MGFLKNMFNEAGSKAGRAIGNKLFPKSTDYVRIGELNGNTAEQARKIAMAQNEAEQERMAAQLVADMLREVLNIRFDANNMNHNIEALAQLDAIIEGLPNRFNRTDDDDRIYKAAKAKIKTGIALCRSIDPNNKALAYFAEKY